MPPGAIAGPRFARERKCDPAYLDIAANAAGEEKGLLLHRALERTTHGDPHLVEVGPGGGAAVEYLASRLPDQEPGGRNFTLTLIEAPGVSSNSLRQAMRSFQQKGRCVLSIGQAEEIADLVESPVDAVGASSLMHEVYSYGGGYSGLHGLMRTLPTVLRPGGFFAYRDVYGVDAGSLHDRVVQSYDSPSWLRFIRMFLPSYLAEGRHPYHHPEDEVLVRQDSRITPIGRIDPRVSAFITAPVGIFREIQRHYITLRDHVWRAGALGFTPILDGQLAHDWIDFRAGHKRVHYTLSGAELLTETTKASLIVMSEPYADHYTIDSDIFDEVTDAALTEFLTSCEHDDDGRVPVWSSWLEREGRETYAYMTIGQLLTAFAVHSMEAEADTKTVLLPVEGSDVMRVKRHYYNRFLRTVLPNPLVDAKQLILFQNIPLTDTPTINNALDTVHVHCGKSNIAKIYTALTSRR
jgi:SAM-dependent methyltransferase